jgi:Ras-related protein Rab-5C
MALVKLPGCDGKESQKIIKYQIWDTAGQEKYTSLAPMYYRSADGAVIVYDVTNLESYRKVKEWVGEVKDNCGEISIVVVGNKTDLLDGNGTHARCVERDEVQEYCESIKAFYIETSAKDDMAIDEVFMKIVENLPGIHDEDDDDSEMGSMRGFKLGDKQGGGGSCC